MGQVSSSRASILVLERSGPEGKLVGTQLGRSQIPLCNCSHTQYYLFSSTSVHCMRGTVRSKNAMWSPCRWRAPSDSTNCAFWQRKVPQTLTEGADFSLHADKDTHSPRQGTTLLWVKGCLLLKQLLSSLSLAISLPEIMSSNAQFAYLDHHSSPSFRPSTEIRHHYRRQAMPVFELQKK